jgi:hypothetical protein
MSDLKAVGSNDQDIDRSARELADLKASRENAKPAGDTSQSPAASPRKKKPATEPKQPTVTAEDIEGASTLFTKALGIFLPNKTPATGEEKEWIEKGARGTFRKYPRAFEYFPIITLFVGLSMFVWNRIRKPAEAQTQQEQEGK